MNQDNNSAIRKRTQIDRTNKIMFLWIAIASALVGVAVVVSIFLVQKVIYEEKVLAVKATTVSTLDKNLKVIDQLKTDVQALDANSALMSVKANPTDQALQVVLDALPSDANSLALGASLQNKLLTNVPGSFTLESLQVDPVSGVEVLDTGDTVDASESSDTSTTSGSASQISFNFSVKGDQQALSGILKNLEKSIRTIVVTNLTVEKQADTLVMSVEGHAFYQPAKTIELTEKVVPNK